MGTTRREFLGTAAIVAGSVAAQRAGFAAKTDAAKQAQPGQTNEPVQFPDHPPKGAVPDFQTPESTKKGDMLYRKLGTTGETVSLLGLGGYHISVPSEEEGIKIVRTAIDNGVTFMDNCWDYANGVSEERMGKALKEGYRKKVFLMTKLDGRTIKSANQQLEESMKRLQTDVIDLVQMHEILRMEDPDRCFDEKGVVHALETARKAGKIRYIGFTGHKDPVVHLRMLDTARQHGFHFDTVQMPLNVMDAHFRSFAHQVIPVALKDGVGILGMKPLAAGEIVRSGTVDPIDCLHYAMNLPTSVVITGCDHLKILEQALKAVRSFSPLKKEEVAAMLAKTAQAAATGRYERFKTGVIFDGTAHNPKWLG